MVLLLNISSIAIVLIYSVFSFEVVKTKSIRTKNFCRYGMYSIQKETSKKINQLLELNPKASALRKEIRSTQLALAAGALLPPVAAALKLRLKYLKIKRLALSTQQKFYYAQIYIYRASSLILFRQKFLKKFNYSKKLSLKQSSVDFKKTPASSSIPSYEVSNIGVIINKTHVNWSTYSNESESHWLKLLGVKNSYTQACSTQLKKEGASWKPQLIIKG